MLDAIPVVHNIAAILRRTNYLDLLRMMLCFVASNAVAVPDVYFYLMVSRRTDRDLATFCLHRLLVYVYRFVHDTLSYS